MTSLSGKSFYAKAIKKDNKLEYTHFVSKEEYLNSDQEKKKRIIQRFDKNNN